jgi:hypothetical protein
MEKKFVTFFPRKNRREFRPLGVQHWNPETGLRQIEKTPTLGDSVSVISETNRF